MLLAIHCIVFVVFVTQVLWNCGPRSSHGRVPVGSTGWRIWPAIHPCRFDNLSTAIWPSVVQAEVLHHSGAAAYTGRQRHAPTPAQVMSAQSDVFFGNIEQHEPVTMAFAEFVAAAAATSAACQQASRRHYLAQAAVSGDGADGLAALMADFDVPLALQSVPAQQLQTNLWMSTRLQLSTGLMCVHLCAWLVEQP